MKNFLKNIIVFSPLVLFLITINFFIDPGCLFYNKWARGNGMNGVSIESDVANILSRDLNVANFPNCDERIMEKCYIENLKNRKNIVVLGASRGVQVGSEIFKNTSLSVHNSCVNGASLEDMIAIFEIYHENKKEPDIVLLVVDPWILNKNNKQTRWRSIGNYYVRYIEEVEEHKNIFLKNRLMFFMGKIKEYLQICSLSYFQRSTRSLFKMIKHGINVNKYFSTESTVLDVNIKLHDGTKIYSKQERSLNVDEVFMKSEQYIATKPVYSLGNFYKMDVRLKNEFEMFVSDLRKRGIWVEFILIPYHPMVYDFLINSDDYNIVLQTEKYFRKVALDHNISVVGSYDPKLCGFTEKSFLDGMHPKKEAIYNLIKDSSILKN